ncbi:glutathione S-transferase N-terminal domain-containing protein [Ancylobacter dichloromethanicus]|uniref:Thiol:disulfide oxidoreductase n=2 Tax=Hyphomicrobiales TaxID=356 RepID=A0A9W6JAA7_9HYPH|nr:MULTISPECIES: glutathione S-transferase N-terminal domain-containing protein [Hyphomicrobiales]MBS7554723.1 glutathione S-transferase N-terminal domain-containing protein [Ancylobacter dichloromethanicus]GLK72329.1 thiol:disulfide oxidoreductase [Ancylobacter dichloromethanicus]CAX24327.1 putative glutathione S-transferase [Methylorubrum extorquens DM4]
MIDFYYAPTPNGWKVAIMLEECGLDYRTVLLSLPTNGDQFAESFLAISPNARIPAIVDHSTGIQPVTVFESGAILLYLFEATGLFGGEPSLRSKERNEWLFWQSANLGPMAGQLSHFVNYAPERFDYALNRYRGEYERCIRVLETRLSRGDYILGEYSIADMMTFPWIFIAKSLGIDLAAFPAVAAWRTKIKSRPAVRRAVDLLKEAQFTKTVNASTHPHLFNQTAQHLAPRSTGRQ